MKLVIGDAYTQMTLGQWLLDRLPHLEPVPNFRAIGIADGSGALVAVAGYYNYSERYRSIEMAFATETPKWATRGAVHALLAYPFVQCGCARATLIIPSRNKRARRFVERLGFVLEGKARQAFLDDDAMIYGMLAAEAQRWLTRPGGRNERAAA